MADDVLLNKAATIERCVARAREEYAANPDEFARSITSQTLQLPITVNIITLHLQEFIECYNTANRNKRKETWHAGKNPDGRWRKFTYEELASRDKTSLDVFWLKDDSLTDLDNLPEPDVLALEIIDNIEAGLQSFRNVAASLRL